MTTNTEASVLHHHGIEGEGQTLVDNAREAGLIWACLGCGSVGGINPTAPLGNHPTFEAARAATRDWAPEGTWECCGDTIVY